MSDAIKSRLGSIPDSYLRTLRPSVQELLRRDIPSLLKENRKLLKEMAKLQALIADAHLMLTGHDEAQTATTQLGPT